MRAAGKLTSTANPVSKSEETHTGENRPDTAFHVSSVDQNMAQVSPVPVRPMFPQQGGMKYPNPNPHGMGRGIRISGLKPMEGGSSSSGRGLRISALPKAGQAVPPPQFPVSEKVSSHSSEGQCDCGRDACDCKGGGMFVDADGQWVRKIPTDTELILRFQRSLPFFKTNNKQFFLYTSKSIPSAIITRDHPNWAPDNKSKKCSRCRKNFSFFLRRHHCRGCGSVVCGKCGSKRLHQQGDWKNIRMCDECDQRRRRWTEKEVVKKQKTGKPGPTASPPMNAADRPVPAPKPSVKTVRPHP